jgi:hypothetical protein
MKHTPVHSIKPNPNNPRKLDAAKFEKLKKSLQEFPEMLEKRPLVVADGFVLGGNMRLRAAQELKFETVPVIDASEWTQEQRDQFLIKDNVSFGEWDWDVLANEWNPAELEEWGLDVWQPDAELGEGLTDPDDVPEVPEAPITQAGDLYILGNHRLLCGDSTNADDVARLMDGATADALVTDPPYGIGIDGQKESKASNPKHNRKAHEFRGWDNERPTAATFELLRSYANEAIIWGGNYFADLLPATRGWLVWDKGQKGLTMSDGELAWTTFDKPLRIFEANRGQLFGSVHPTQKPALLIEWCLTLTEGTVFDPFLGSGTTLIAAEKTGRTCYGMELDPKYCDVIVKRWEDFTGKKAERVNGL